MSDELLPYYERELTYIRQLASKFGDDNPKIAKRLRLGAEGSDDPHVERLIEGFAYLTARIRKKLDDEFPEIVSSLLDALFPHYQAPIPSMAIVQFQLDPGQAPISSGYTLRAGTELETELIQGEPCRFRTCYPVTLWPLELRLANLMQAPFRAPKVVMASDALSSLRLVVYRTSKELLVSTLGGRKLRFFLRSQAHAFRLYELLMNRTIGVAVARSADDPDPILLGPEALSPVGFERDEGMLPYPPRSFVGHRLLTEYFSFPQKFLFVDLQLPELRSDGNWGDSFEVFIFLSRSLQEVSRTVTAETFQLGCAPIVNLYRQRASPIQLSHTTYEYRVEPDPRRPLAHEVYSIDRVVASPPRGEPVEFRPFFSIQHNAEANASRSYWHATRRSSTMAKGESGTEVHLALVDLDFRPSAPADWILDVETTCLNQDLPSRLPFGADQPRLQIRDGNSLISRISCLTPPTATVRPQLGRGMLWRLVSHLTLNHLSLVGDPKAEALREILKLYDFADQVETRRQIDGVVQVNSRRIVSYAPTEGPISFCRGLEIGVEFAEDRFPTGNLYLFASVLERYLALHCTINSFTKMVATVRGREGELRRWPPRVGERIMA